MHYFVILGVIKNRNSVYCKKRRKEKEKKKWIKGKEEKKR